MSINTAKESTIKLTELNKYLLNEPLHNLIRESNETTRRFHGNVMTYSKKVFIPLTKLCRNVCHYCTFAKHDNALPAYMHKDQVLNVVRNAVATGCKEVLFTLGDKPELRYIKAANELSALGYTSTVEYLYDIAETVIKETGLLPHVNAGLLSIDELSLLRKVSPSMGLMLETSAERLCTKGHPHFGSPDKLPEKRIECIRNAGRLSIPFTSGILVGIGETRAERLESLSILKELHREYGHIQEIIIQNFVPKEDTLMRFYPPAEKDELLWTIAVARIIFGEKMSIQTPPNLNLPYLDEIIEAGINDWGGISPVTPDYVNPESQWPDISDLTKLVATKGKILTERLTIYPDYIHGKEKWLDKQLFKPVLDLADASGLARCENWAAGAGGTIPSYQYNPSFLVTIPFKNIVRKALAGDKLSTNEITSLFMARGPEVEWLCRTADELRKSLVGNNVSYVINCNINYSNICSYKCSFCSFSRKSRQETNLEGQYLMELEDIIKTATIAYERGATEVCLQGGIHPSFDGNTYLNICKGIKDALPDIHIHAFSPVEINHGATTLGISVKEFLQQLKTYGLGSLPGTAGEILNDDVRRQLSCNKISTSQWSSTIKTAHQLDIPTTSTIMFGHLEGIEHWAEHLLIIRNLQSEGGKITEFVPLPFVHMKAPVYLKGAARKGPSFREVLLMYAVSRLVLYPHIQNIQVSWTKLGLDGAMRCLDAGANDMGGSLMSESISRAAGAVHGQYVDKDHFREIILASGKNPVQRNTTYSYFYDE